MRARGEPQTPKAANEMPGAGRPRIRLVHWNAAKAAEWAEALRADGYDVDDRPPQGPGFLKELAAAPPAAVVIDLSRLPGQGRDLAVMIRRRKGTRLLPLVFVGGAGEKLTRVREVLPDASFTAWDEIGVVLAGAINAPIGSPVVPGSVFAAYSGRRLTDKLGIRPGTMVCVLGSPAGWAATLGELPPGTTIAFDLHPAGNPVLWFVRAGAELASTLPRMVREIADRRLWIVWPKRSGAAAGDLTQQFVRDAGLGAGLVDYKICSLDQTWSGLLFGRRRRGNASAERG